MSKMPLMEVQKFGMNHLRLPSKLNRVLREELHALLLCWAPERECQPRESGLEWAVGSHWRKFLSLALWDVLLMHKSGF
ncbi:hypothetical protein QQP08_016035 [Theobroma cacao]|nr:hypothetical protein QQP08_016035 [Theobroma cacao]